MISVRVRVRGIEEISKKLSGVPFGARGAATEAAAKVLIGNQATGLQHYPAPRSGSSYIRTFLLRFGWKVSAWGDGTSIRIRNEVEHAPYVQGNTTQAWMHVGRWRTVAKVITDNTAAMHRAINQAVARFLKSKGF